MGICTIVLAVGLRRAGVTSKGITTLLLVGAVITMVPLPSRFFMLSFALGALALAPGELAAEEDVPVGRAAALA